MCETSGAGPDGFDDGVPIEEIWIIDQIEDGRAEIESHPEGKGQKQTSLDLNLELLSRATPISSSAAYKALTSTEVSVLFTERIDVDSFSAIPIRSRSFCEEEKDFCHWPADPNLEYDRGMVWGIYD